MQGPNHPGELGEENRGGFFHQHRWDVPVGTVLLTNLFYVFGVKALIAKEPVKSFEFVEATHGAAFWLFSLLPFSESYHARLQSADSDPMRVMLVIHSHAVVLLISALLLLLLLIKSRRFTDYIAEKRELARTDLSRSHYFNASRMLFVVLPCLAGFLISTALPGFSKPDLILDGALLSALFTPLLIHYGMCAVLLAHLPRSSQSEA